MQIINPGQKNVALWGGNFPLDCLFPKEYFGAIRISVFAMNPAS